jgi:hypothetical protein
MLRNLCGEVYIRESKILRWFDLQQKFSKDRVMFNALLPTEVRECKQLEQDLLNVGVNVREVNPLDLADLFGLISYIIV